MTVAGSDVMKERDSDVIQTRHDRLAGSDVMRAGGIELVSSAFTICVTHQALGHDDGRAWSDCRFRQLFYFENPMDEHTILWSDEIAPPAVSEAGPLSDGPAHSDRAHSAATGSPSDAQLRPEPT